MSKPKRKEGLDLIGELIEAILGGPYSVVDHLLVPADDAVTMYQMMRVYEQSLANDTPIDKRTKQATVDALKLLFRHSSVLTNKNMVLLSAALRAMFEMPTTSHQAEDSSITKH